jgi:hypothetical protein
VINLPPIFFYAIGTLFVVFGGLRAIFLGRRRRDRDIGEETPERAKMRRRHLVWGCVQVVAGAILIASTAGVLGMGR